MHLMHIHASITSIRRLGILIQTWCSPQRFNLISYCTCSETSYGITLCGMHTSFGPWPEILQEGRQLIEDSDKPCHESSNDDVKNLAPTTAIEVLSSPHLLGIAFNHGVLQNLEFLEHLISRWFTFTVGSYINASFLLIPTSYVVTTLEHSTIQPGALSTALCSLICSTTINLHSPSELKKRF